MSKWYVGMKNPLYPFDFGVTQDHYEMFQSEETPTRKTHNKYDAVIGPFRTKRGATYMKKYGHNNPHIRNVNDAERIAKATEGNEYGKSRTV